MPSILDSRNLLGGACKMGIAAQRSPVADVAWLEGNVPRDGSFESPIGKEGNIRSDTYYGHEHTIRKA